MPRSDDELRYLFAHAFETAMPGDDCPPPEVLLDAVHGLLAERQRLELVDHLASCGVCAEAWRLARQTPSPSPDRG